MEYQFCLSVEKHESLFNEVLDSSEIYDGVRWNVLVADVF